MDIPPTSTVTPLIAFEKISKRFDSFWANREISLEIFEGEIHAVVGENGAGKSTLMKILYGYLQPDAGQITLRGVPVTFRHPREAMRAGIGMVHQQLLIFPQLTALENIIMGSEPKRWGWLRRKAAREKVLQFCRNFGFTLPLDTPAGELAHAYRQHIELLRVLYRDASILILDEPTSLLAPKEVEQLLQLLRKLRSRGHTILFISHRLKEVFALANRLSVLRQGKWVGTRTLSQTTKEEIARMIVSGKTIESVEEEKMETECLKRPRARDMEPLMTLKEVFAQSGKHETGLKDFSLNIERREILGIGCVVGNGERTLAQVLAGFTPLKKGHLLFDGAEISRTPANQRMQQGFRWLPANPPEEALLSSRSLWENCLLGSQRESSNHSKGWLLKGRIKRWVRERLGFHGVHKSDIQSPLSSLSGGNQQKVALARVLSGSPRFIIMEQPGRGLDINAREQLRRHVRTLNACGVTFLVISYDLDELLLMSHRIGILYQGKLMGIVDTQEADRERLGRWMLGLTDESSFATESEK